MKDAEPRSLLSRRDFLKLAGYGAAGLGFYGLWKLNYDAHASEKLLKLNEWEPKVAYFLRETLESENLDNLKVFTEIARPQFVDLVSKGKDLLVSPAPDSNATRYNLLAFALGEHYGLKIPTYEEGPAIPFYKDTLSFLDRTITRVDAESIKGKGAENQANMWVEAIYRSYAAAWELDPTIKDGVYIPENQSVFGRVLAESNRFIKLQPHP